MDTTWSGMTRHDQTKWLVENLLSRDGWKWFESWDALATSVDQGNGKPMGWPEGTVVFWQEDANIGWVVFDDDECGDQRPFTPTEGMDAACLIIESMKQRLFSVRERFKTALDRMIHEKISGFAHCSEVLFHTTPQMICDAAYEAISTEVIPLSPLALPQKKPVRMVSKRGEQLGREMKQ